MDKNVHKKTGSIVKSTNLVPIYGMASEPDSSVRESQTDILVLDVPI